MEILTSFLILAGIALTFAFIVTLFDRHNHKSKK